MFWIVVRILVACSLVVCVPKLSDWCPSMSGIIGVMPVFSLLFLLCIYFDYGGRENVKVVEYVKTAAIGMIPGGLLYLGIFCALEKWGMNIPAAIGVGVGIWLTFTIVYQMLMKMA